MSMKRALIIMLVLSLPLFAQESKPWMFHFRAISVSPDDSSETILNTGTSVGVDSAVVPEIDFTYFFNEHWSAELILATSPHDLATENGALAGADAGKVWALPPTVTAQYHFLPTSAKVDPYVGLGVNFTYFYNYDLSDDLKGLGVTDVDFTTSVGLAGQVGLNVDISEKWFLNFDLKYAKISTDATLKTAAGDLDKIKVDIDPYIFGVGAGFRF